jgi:hypothetical protein
MTGILRIAVAIGSASKHRIDKRPPSGVFDPTTGLEKPRVLAEWRPWARV